MTKSITPKESPYNAGWRFAKDGGGLSGLWGVVPKDSDLDEAFRGYQDALLDTSPHPKMKVWIGYECYYNFCDEWKSVAKVFDNEVKALVWKDEFKPTETEWRTYEEVEVE